MATDIDFFKFLHSSANQRRDEFLCLQHVADYFTTFYTFISFQLIGYSY